MPTLSKSKKKPAQSGAPEKIEVRYTPVREVALTEANPKKHDIGGLCESISRYGFRDPAIWDETLNDGRGGIAAGNGRTEALAAMEKQNLPVPRGIAIDDQGRWCMPIVFGCDAMSEAEAIAFLIDHNNLTVSGSDLSHWDAAKLWEREGYIALLTSIADAEVVPVTVDEDAIAALLAGMDADPLSFQMDSSGDGKPDRDSESESQNKSLADRFVVPPFSVLDARQGYWQERKRLWLSIGIKSELGRGESLITNGGGMSSKAKYDQGGGK